MPDKPNPENLAIPCAYEGRKFYTSELRECNLTPSALEELGVTCCGRPCEFQYNFGGPLCMRYMKPLASGDNDRR